MNRFFLLLWLCCFSNLVSGQDSLKLMFYNVYRFPVNVPAGRETLLRNIVDYVQPDLLMACELVNERGADLILDSAFTTISDPFERAVFHYSQTAVDDPLQQMVFFNARKLSLIFQQVYPTGVRDINHYRFLLNTSQKASDSVLLDVFVAHLKSSQGPANREARKNMVDTFVRALELLPSNRHVVFAGDFNFYEAENEPGYQRLLDTMNWIRMYDPVQSPGKWHDQPEFASLHTQSTRTSLTGFGMGGAAGGLDDRFDFIMLSESLQSGADLHYQEGSYQVIGNNGNCFDERVDNSACAGAYSQELRYYLHQMSDHLPVALSLKTSAPFTGINPVKKPAPELKLQGANLVSSTLTLQIQSRLPFGGGTYYIYDLPGKVLESGNISSGAVELTASVGHLPAGMYFLRLEACVFRFLKW